MRPIRCLEEPIMKHTLFSDVSVLDGTGAAPFHASVLVSGQRIAAIIPAGAPVAVPEDTEVILSRGMTLMPGLTEAHAHPSYLNIPNLHALGEVPPEEHLLETVKNVKLMLDCGFTSLCSAASGKARIDIVVRNAINKGDIPGPRMLAASPEMTVTGGLGDPSLLHLHRETFAVILDGPDEFRRYSRLMCREGVDTLKINPSGDEFVPFARAEMTCMNEAEIAAVCEVAKSRNKRVMAHARSAESVKMCLRQGIDLINHATFSDEEALDGLEAARHRVFVIPAIGVIWTALHEASEWGITPQIAEGLGMKREVERACRVMPEMRRRGIRVLPGGDYGFAWNPIGNNARDLEYFVDLFGFTPMEAIVAATRFGGELMMRGHELGQIKPGFLADLLLVIGDPLADIRILQDRNRMLGIMKDGAFHKHPGAPAAAQRLAAD
jgi:imidazolonepropionase-like amidohydrolase